MATRALRSPLSLVVLGLLAEQPLHPYGMRVLIKERRHDRIIKARPASLYDAVARLQDAGLVEVRESGRAGRRPERTVYRLTEIGGSELRIWVREDLGDIHNPERFVAALSFMYTLPKREAIDVLTHRAAALVELTASVDHELDTAIQSGVPAIFLSEERYAQALRLAEHQWLQDFTKRLQDGTLRWPTRPRHPARTRTTGPA